MLTTSELQEIQWHERPEAEAEGHPFAEMALETIATAAFLVAAGGEVLKMNRLATAMVKRAQGLRLEGAGLAVPSSHENTQLLELIAGAAVAGRRASRAARGGALVIRRHGHRHSLHVSVQPVPDICRRLMGAACALVVASDPAASPRSRASVLRNYYALTPAEARMADLLLEGLGLRQAALRMGITVETARFQLKRVLAKTGTHRQAELMRLMLLLPGNA